MSDLVELRIDFSKDELENVKRAAELEGMTVDEWIVKAIKIYLKELGAHVG